MVFTICQRARPREGCWYLATISFQGAVSIGLLFLALVELGSFNSVIIAWLPVLRDLTGNHRAAGPLALTLRRGHSRSKSENVRMVKSILRANRQDRNTTEAKRVASWPYESAGK